MHPILFRIGAASIQTYSVFSLLAMFASMIVVRSEARRLGWNLRDSTWLVVKCTVLGFFGAHALYALTRLDLPFQQWLLLAMNFGYGFVWFGGFLCSWGYCMIYARKQGIPFAQMCDVAAFAVLVAQPVGRLGCLFGGCCYGSPSALPWAIAIPSSEYSNTPLHPAPLYEALALTILFILLWMRRRETRQTGQIAIAYLVFAPLIRFLVEFTRGDTVRGFTPVFGLSTSQAIAVLIFISGLALKRKLICRAS